MLESINVPFPVPSPTLVDPEYLQVSAGGSNVEENESATKEMPRRIVISWLSKSDCAHILSP